MRAKLVGRFNSWAVTRDKREGQGSGKNWPGASPVSFIISLHAENHAFSCSTLVFSAFKTTAGLKINYNRAGIHRPLDEQKTLDAWKRLLCFKTLNSVSDTLNFIDTYASTLITGVSSQYKISNFFSYFQTFFFYTNCFIFIYYSIYLFSFLYMLQLASIQ